MCVCGHCTVCTVSVKGACGAGSCRALLTVAETESHLECDSRINIAHMVQVHRQIHEHAKQQEEYMTITQVDMPSCSCNAGCLSNRRGEAWRAHFEDSHGIG